MQAALIKILALLAFCGGPLYVCDLLKPALGQDPAFVLCYGPVGLMVFASFSLMEDAPTAFAKAVVVVGAVGALIVLGMDVFTAWRLMSGPAYADRGLVSVGVPVGVLAVALYGWYTVRFFRRTIDAAPDQI